MMAPRVSSDLLLVGSLPAESTNAALSAAGQLFGSQVFALPDGETGKRSGWVAYERDWLFGPHPDIETVEVPRSPAGLPMHTYDVPTFQLRPHVDEVHFRRWPRIDDAIESYRVFRSLRHDGVIPSDVRFQVGLPLPASAIVSGFRKRFTHEYPVIEAAYEDLVRREIERLLQVIPSEDLAVQWDVCYEVLDLEGVIAWTDGDPWERFAGPASRLSPLFPEDVLLGYHLCYGTFPEWPMYEPRDMGLLVHMANAAKRFSGRRVDWFHVAGPRHLRSEEDAFFRPLNEFTPGEARVYLGIVLPIDGIEGLRRRAETASRYLPDFGVAMYCGFGRQPGQDGLTTMRQHRTVVDALCSSNPSR